MRIIIMETYAKHVFFCEGNNVMAFSIRIDEERKKIVEIEEAHLKKDGVNEMEVVMNFLSVGKDQGTWFAAVEVLIKR